jgi:hypothetical protein
VGSGLRAITSLKQALLVAHRFSRPDDDAGAAPLAAVDLRIGRIARCPPTATGRAATGALRVCPGPRAAALPRGAQFVTAAEGALCVTAALCAVRSGALSTAVADASLRIAVAGDETRLADGGQHAGPADAAPAAAAVAIGETRRTNGPYASRFGVADPAQAAPGAIARSVVRLPLARGRWRALRAPLLPFLLLAFALRLRQPQQGEGSAESEPTQEPCQIATREGVAQGTCEAIKLGTVHRRTLRGYDEMARSRTHSEKRLIATDNLAASNRDG